MAVLRPLLMARPRPYLAPGESLWGGAGGGGGLKPPAMSPPSPAGNPAGPKGMRFPRSRRTWQPSKGLLAELARKAQLTKDLLRELWEDVGEPSDMPPYVVPFSYGLSGNWTRCADPTTTCENTWGPPTHYRTFAVTACALGPCPTGQSQSLVDMKPLAGAFVVPSTHGTIWWAKKTGSGPGFGVFSVFRSDTRPVGVAETVDYRAGTIVLPDVSAPAEPATQEKAYAVSKAAAAVVAPAGAGQGTRPPGEPNVNAPQPPGTPEQKWILPTQTKPHKLLGSLSEAGETADCMEKAVRATGARRKPGEKGRRGQMAFLARSLAAGHGDPLVFFTCVMNDQQQDRAIGAFNREGRDAMRKNPYWRSPRGPGFGGWGQRMR